MRGTLRLGLLVAGVQAVACGGTTPTQPTPPGPVASPSVATSAQADPSSTVVATPSAVPTVAGPKVTTLPPSPFHPVMKTTDSGDLMRFDDGVVYVSGMRLAPLRAGRFDFDETHSKGLPSYAQIVSLNGSWKTGASLVALTGNGRVGWGESYRYRGGRWLAGTWRSPARYVPEYSSAWRPGTTIVLSVDSMWFGHGPAFRLSAIGAGAKRVKVPKLPSKARRQTGDMTPCWVHPYIPTGLTAVTTGEVFLFVTDCQTRALQLRTFSAAGKETAGPVPGGVSDVNHIDCDARAGTAACTVAGKGGVKIVIYRAGTWQAIEAPDAAGAPTVSNDGTVYFASGGHLRRVVGERTEVMPAPSGVSLSGAVAFTDTQVFVTGSMKGDDRHTCIYGTEKPAAGVQEAAFTSGQRPRTLKLPKAATAECPSLYVLLYGFTKVTPADYEFPLTGKAVKGQAAFKDVRFVVVEDNGKKYFGAFVPDMKVGRALVKRIAAKVKNSKPALLCAAPKVLREVTYQ